MSEIIADLFHDLFVLESIILVSVNSLSGILQNQTHKICFEILCYLPIVKSASIVLVQSTSGQPEFHVANNSNRAKPIEWIIFQYC
jgi:hypothetical protein